MNAELEVLGVVTQRLEAAGLAYMVSGSIALNFYAQPRMTRDIDLVVELKPADAQNLVALFEPEFSCDLEEIADAIRRRRMFNLIHIEKVVKVDFIVRKAEPYREVEFKRRRPLTFLERRLWVVTPEDLVLSKLLWAKDSHSDFQLRDVRNVLSSERAIDWPYLERWAKELGVISLLQEVRP